jgi:hypothetical protein
VSHSRSQVNGPAVITLSRAILQYRCIFKLAFRIDKHRLVLEAAARSGLVGIALKPLSIDAVTPAPGR